MRLTRGAAAATLLSLLAAGALGAAPALADPPSTDSPAQLASARALTPGTGPVSFSLIAPITVPTDPAGSGLLSADTLASDTDVAGTLTRELDAVSGTAAVLAIDPRVVVSIRVLGTAAPASARDWLQRLEQLPNEKFPLAYGDADPGVLARAGGLNLLSGLDFQFAVQRANFGPSASPTPTDSVGTGSGSDAGVSSSTPTPTPTATQPPGPPPLPSNDDLMAGDYVTDDIAWPAPGTVATDELAPLASAGYRTVLVDSGNIATTSSALVSFGGIDGLVSDDGVSAIVREASGATGQLVLQSALARLDAALEGMQAVAPGRAVVATLDRHWASGALHVRELLQNIDGLASVQSVGLSSILAGPKTSAQLVDGTIPADGSALLTAVLDTVPAEASFATVAGDRASDVTAPRRLQLLTTMAVTWIETDAGWADRLQAYLASSAKLLDAVKIVHGSNQLVTATSSNIPVVVSNALDVPVTVLVTVNPNSGYLRMDKRQVPLKIEPNASGKALMSAQALSTYKITAVVVLHSAARPAVEIGDRDVISVDLRPSWEGIGTAVIIAVLVLIFGGGIARQILKRRKARAATAERDTTEPDTTDPDRR